jgi:hypothetical protein
MQFPLAIGCLVLDNQKKQFHGRPKTKPEQTAPHAPNIVGLVYQLAIAADEIHQSHQT